MKDPKVYNITDDGVETGGKFIEMSDEKLNYRFNFEALEPTFIIENSYNYSFTQFKMKMARNDEGRNKLFGSYHASTGTFAILSLVSYFIGLENFVTQIFATQIF